MNRSSSSRSPSPSHWDNRDRDRDRDRDYRDRRPHDRDRDFRDRDRDRDRDYRDRDRDKDRDRDRDRDRERPIARNVSTASRYIQQERERAREMQERLNEQQGLDEAAAAATEAPAMDEAQLEASIKQRISAAKLATFAVGQQTVTPYAKRKAEEDARKKATELEAARVYEEFVSSFMNPPSGRDSKSGGSRGSSFVSAGFVQHGRSTEAPTLPSAAKPSSDTPASKSTTFDRTKLAAAVDDQAYEEMQQQMESLSQPKARAPSSQPPTLRATSVFDDGAAAEEEEPQPKKKDKQKKKSNLELFKEELRQKQEIRDDRNKQREAASILGSRPSASSSKSDADDDVFPTRGGSFDTGDPTTTNIFLSNLHPTVDEELLCMTFGPIGPLASVKIMWPRSEDQVRRGRNSGFVAFMTRQAAEKALEQTHGMVLNGMEIRGGWSKAIAIPANPVYVHTAASVPKLPFNAQPRTTRAGASVPPPSSQGNDPDVDPAVLTAQVQVVIPSNATVLRLIHRVIEFVVQYGPAFEAHIIDRESQGENAEQFRFLTDFLSEEHVYYRWKLFSVLQGDHRRDGWSTEEFRMFQNGSWWVPPPHPAPGTAGRHRRLDRTSQKPARTERDHDPTRQPAQLTGAMSVAAISTSKHMTDAEAEELEFLLHRVNLEATRIADLMIFALSHASAADEIVDCIVDALSLIETPLNVKIARFYVISDILHNSLASVPNASQYRRRFEQKLPEIVPHLAATYRAIVGRIRAEQFKSQVMAAFRAWEERSLFVPEFLASLRAAFLAAPKTHATAGALFTIANPSAPQQPIQTSASKAEAGGGITKTTNNWRPVLAAPEVNVADLDGEPLDDIDGEPLDDIDGVPMED
ncbi:U2-associated SR140 protein [Capsaspora owczarzaki ATCC 30864]|nr:U2-associated SR140 protein [Capsaspora owczarzaki ATCC 30864]|eukprot:XP_004349856.1 U2-associated SR140 protein [Capsaspora owczarzaki ATCC 30864]